MQLANQVVAVPNGRVTLSNARYTASMDGQRARLRLYATIRTAELQGWTSIDADAVGFTTMTPEADLGNPARYDGAIPSHAVLESLPDHGAAATWTKQDVTEGTQSCAALRQYADPVPDSDRPRYYRTIFLTACSATLSHKDLVFWVQDAVPGLSGKLK